MHCTGKKTDRKEKAKSASSCGHVFVCCTPSKLFAVTMTEPNVAVHHSQASGFVDQLVSCMQTYQAEDSARQATCACNRAETIT